MSTKSLPVDLRTPTRVPVTQLRFDLHNPRYTPEQELARASDAQVVAHLVATADLGELLQSIATSGYIDIDPLIVLWEKDHYLVLEGNRRLAALRVLSDKDLAADCGIELPAIAEGVSATLTHTTVYRVATREDARDFIGFKHINGPHRWDSIAKARFAAEWYRNKRDEGMTLSDIARRMGDRHDTIQRMVAGIYVLEQAQVENVFTVADRFPGRPFSFSHLYTALTRPGYRNYLGLEDDWRGADPEPNPVPKDKLDELGRVMLWLFGSKQNNVRPIVISQNPHIKELGEILAKPKARAILLAKNDLRAAYAEVDSPGIQFERSLVEAHQHTENALKKVASYDPSDKSLLEVAQELSSAVAAILSIMLGESGRTPAEDVKPKAKRR